MATPEEITQKKEYLKQAKEALHGFMLGQTVVEVVDQNGERVKYSAVNIGRLQTYIAMLERDISGCPSGPMRVYNGR